LSCLDGISLGTKIVWMQGFSKPTEQHRLLGEVPAGGIVMLLDVLVVAALLPPAQSNDVAKPLDTLSATGRCG
jgi:hypothetical protein